MKISQFIKMKNGVKDIYKDTRMIILMIYIQLGFGLGSYFGIDQLQNKVLKIFRTKKILR